jgi:hypothetical protein
MVTAGGRESRPGRAHGATHGEPPAVPDRRERTAAADRGGVDEPVDARPPAMGESTASSTLEATVALA